MQIRRTLLRIVLPIRQKISSVFSLFALQPDAIESTVQPVADAVRWIEHATIGGQRMTGLFMHPRSSAEFVVDVPAGSALVTWVGVLPPAWPYNRSGVCFTVRVQQGNQQTSHTLTVRPLQHKSDRVWVPVVVPLSSVAGPGARILLSTDVPAGTSATHAWAVWGNPTVQTLLPPHALFDKMWRHVRVAGLFGAFRSLTHDRSLHQPDPYQLWVQRHTLHAADKERLLKQCEQFSTTPTISIITPVYNVDPRWLRECVESVKAQYYPHWQLCLCDDGSTRKDTLALLRQYASDDQRITVRFLPKNRGISGASNAALEQATGEFMALLDNDDTLAPEALVEVAALLQQHHDADMIYSDEDKLDLDGNRVEPFFKPDWSPEYFLSCMYTSHLGVYRRSIIESIGGFRSAYDKAQDYDLVLRFIEKTTANRIHHIPRVLYHWRKIPGSTAASLGEKDFSGMPMTRAVQDYLDRNHSAAQAIFDPVTTYHRIKYQIQGNPLVSILLPTNGRVVEEHGKKTDLLVQCLKSIEEKTTYKNYEIVLAHNGNLTTETERFVTQQAKKTGRYRVVRYHYEEPFNFADKLDFIAQHATGEYYLILNDDIEVISPEWMSALLEYAQLPEIGVVGAKLYFPDGRIQHAGVVMGIGGGASHVFTQCAHDDPGYFASTKVVKNFSVVTGACCMTKASIFKELKGLDRAFRIDYNDVDFCLRVRERGYRVVFTPYAELTHHESVSLGSRRGQTDRPEERLLRTRWANVISRDPYYNPHLTLKDTGYHLAV